MSRIIQSACSINRGHGGVHNHFIPYWEIIHTGDNTFWREVKQKISDLEKSMEILLKQQNHGSDKIC